MANALHDLITEMDDAQGADLTGSRRDAPRDQAFVDRMGFVAACFDLAKTHPVFAVIAADDKPDMSAITKAIDKASPVLAAIGDSLDVQIEELAAWNIRAAGKNEVIANDIQRNWVELEKLGWANPSA